MTELPWPTFINTVQTFSTRTRYIELPDRYILNSWDEIFQFSCIIIKAQDLIFSADFENNYKSTFNSLDLDFGIDVSSTQTNDVIRSTTSGKRFVLTDFLVNIRNTGLTAQSANIFDETNVANNRLIGIGIGAGENLMINYSSPTKYVFSEINNNLRITTSSGLMVRGRFKGYETF